MTGGQLFSIGQGRWAILGVAGNDVGDWRGGEFWFLNPAGSALVSTTGRRLDLPGEVLARPAWNDSGDRVAVACEGARGTRVVVSDPLVGVVSTYPLSETATAVGWAQEQLLLGVRGPEGGELRWGRFDAAPEGSSRIQLGEGDTVQISEIAGGVIAVEQRRPGCGIGEVPPTPNCFHSRLGFVDRVSGAVMWFDGTVDSSPLVPMEHGSCVGVIARVLQPPVRGGPWGPTLVCSDGVRATPLGLDDAAANGVRVGGDGFVYPARDAGATRDVTTKSLWWTSLDSLLGPEQ